MAVAVLQYKCRNCGKVYDGAIIDWRNSVMYSSMILVGKTPPGIPQGMHDLHYCKDSGSQDAYIGVADFIGVVKREE